MAHIIVVGNEKGGSGKSTTSMHVATALARMGHRVAALDLDIRQRSFGRYLENRAYFTAKENLDLPTPTLGTIEATSPNDTDPLSVAVAALEPDHEFLLIDCPGSHTRLAQMAHMLADTLITPLNDSFIDFDLLARMSPEGSPDMPLSPASDDRRRSTSSTVTGATFASTKRTGRRQVAARRWARISTLFADRPAAPAKTRSIRSTSGPSPRSKA